MKKKVLLNRKGTDNGEQIELYDKSKEKCSSPNKNTIQGLISLSRAKTWVAMFNLPEEFYLGTKLNPKLLNVLKRIYPESEKK